MKKISEEKKSKIITMYFDKTYTIEEISNLNDVSKMTIYRLINTIIPKEKLQHRAKKLTDKQEKIIAIDYYENNLSTNQIQKKYNINRVEMQRIREQYKKIYGIKQNAPNVFKVRHLKAQNENTDNLINESKNS